MRLIGSTTSIFFITSYITEGILCGKVKGYFLIRFNRSIIFPAENGTLPKII
jgi:hypothetical protein